MKQPQTSAIAAHIQAGFIIPAAIFLIVVLAALGAYAVTISTTQSFSSAQDVQGSRAYHAARSGLEWEVYQMLDPTNATVAAMVAPYGTGSQAWPNFPPCPTTPTVLTIDGFTVTVSCTPTPSASAVYNENTTVRSIRVYSITSRAESGTVNTPGRIERELQVTLSKCRATDGVAPSYECGS
jgi:MSHA biogenesis protein MshP